MKFIAFLKMRNDKKEYEVLVHKIQYGLKKNMKQDLVFTLQCFQNGVIIKEEKTYNILSISCA